MLNPETSVVYYRSMLNLILVGVSSLDCNVWYSFCLLSYSRLCYKAVAFSFYDVIIVPKSYYTVQQWNGCYYSDYYINSFFGLMIKFSPSVSTVWSKLSAVRFLFIWPSGPDSLSLFIFWSYSLLLFRSYGQFFSCVF